MQLLSSSEDALTSARATLGTVAALWSSVRTPEVDFGEQQKLISDAVNKVAVVRLELQTLAVSGSLQQSLWQARAQPGIRTAIAFLAVHAVTYASSA